VYQCVMCKRSIRAVKVGRKEVKQSGILCGVGVCMLWCY